ncbi:heterodisulfide reductase subunit A [Desulfonispora thiosulfatigenes DSM 11270]|uniref:Heterodisulfide reductase subunit A n=1 Tax=Desulfonispora thiosulfatigenes DSM 11270 TaxID=656914 RepID=A0A1W1VSX9_DESTI|nr:CoB--CoM heterodisulfide reductase iron-sulfur subunit A family protein [Desulfonispora thiosulfatigenes]SMB96482.1 heterodisulfide reductase subunit A [Desulfonispora thiosulfatigenes DSM 11270]
MRKVGVFVCHCGTNISSAVDVEKVAENAKSLPGVAFATDYKYMCSEPGQDLIQNSVKEQGLDRIVVACCSPRMHEKTFQKCMEKAEKNAYMTEIANIREQCAWVHPNNMEKATEKAIDLVKMATAKVLKNEPLTRSTIPITKRALIVGAGIAGIQAAIDIANAGITVDLVEREPSIGGRMSQIDKTFPTLDCAACISTPKMVEASSNPNINIITHAEIEKVDGFVGNFNVDIKKKVRYVDMDLCTGCGTCMEKCPSKVVSEFNLGLMNRKAIYTPFPQAIPNIPVIDSEKCLKLTKNVCGICQKVCPTKAIDFELKEEVITREYGAILVATGFDLFDYSLIGEYGFGKYKNVISALQFERIFNASGPTSGKVLRPSDWTEPKNVVFVKCAGSRETDGKPGKTYCSRACCMYTAKQATLVRDKLPNSNVYVFYMDVRTAGKAYDEFYNRTREQYGANYIRGKVSKVTKEGEQLIVYGADTLLGEQVKIEADLVVLSTAMIPHVDAKEMAQKLGISTDKDGFFTEAHPKLAPVETTTAGVYLAGCCQGPKDIPDTVAQASAAAAKICALLSKAEMETEPVVSIVDNKLCSGCGMCAPICPYSAIDLKTIQERVMGKTLERTVASVNDGLCQGCGACTVACRSSAINIQHFTNEQILAEVDALCL